MKRALHFATKRNSHDIKKCNCFWVASSDLFASARKAVHGKGPRNYNVQPRRVGWGVCVCVCVGGGGETQFDPKSSTVLSEPKFGPPPHPPLKIPGSSPGLSFTIVRTYIPKTNLSFTTLTPSAAAASKF